MKHRSFWVIAIALAVCALFAMAQQPITTGQFPSATTDPPPTLILLNQSRLSDSTLADIANSLSGKTLNVTLATRLSGVGTCGTGEWCLAVTDSLIGSGSDTSAWAMLGSEVAKEIVRKVL